MTENSKEDYVPIDVQVPKGIRYLSQWEEFSIPDFPCIIDKQVTGCGFTEFCLENDENVVLCAPRKVLIENKERKHNVVKKGELREVYYAKNIFERPSAVDINLKSKAKREIEETEELTE